MDSEPILLNANEQVKRFRTFLESYCYLSITGNLGKGCKFVSVDFTELAKSDIDLADLLLKEPEDTIRAAEIAAEQLPLDGIAGFKVEFYNLPKSNQRNIWEVRSEDIGKMISLKGIINKASAITHVCGSAKFECPLCGSVINILQLDNHFKEPSKCGCGRKGKFTLLEKQMVDTIKMGLIDDLMDKSNMGRSIAREKLSILSGQDLTSYDTDRKIKIGRKVMLNGYFKYVQKTNSTEFDSVFHVNSIEFVEVGWPTVAISKAEERQIKELAKQDDIIERLSESIADVEGFPEIKKACLLLLAGAPHMYDKNKHLTSRGTIHVLLIFDP